MEQTTKNTHMWVLPLAWSAGVLEGYEPEQVSLPTIPTLLPGGTQRHVSIKARCGSNEAQSGSSLTFHQPVLLC